MNHNLLPFTNKTPLIAITSLLFISMVSDGLSQESDSHDKPEGRMVVEFQHGLEFPERPERPHPDGGSIEGHEHGSGESIRSAEGSKTSNVSTSESVGSTASPITLRQGVELSPETRKELNEIALRYNRFSGDGLVVTDGIRSSATQAVEMYKQLQSEERNIGESTSPLDKYRQQKIVSQLRDIYNHTKTGSSAHTIQLLGLCLEQWKSRGVLMSNHMSGTAADLSIRNVNEANLKQLLTTLASSGAQVILEVPPKQIRAARLFKESLGPSVSGYIAIGAAPYTHLHVDFHEAPSSHVLKTEYVVVPTSFKFRYAAENAGLRFWSQTGLTTWQERTENGQVGNFHIVFRNYDERPAGVVLQKDDEPSFEILVPDLQDSNLLMCRHNLSPWSLLSELNEDECSFPEEVSSIEHRSF